MDRTWPCGGHDSCSSQDGGTMKLSTPVSNIAKIGPVYAKRLKKMGIQTTGDLLFHFPVRYIDFSQIKKIADLKINEPACIKGTVEDIKNEISYNAAISFPIYWILSIN